MQYSPFNKFYVTPHTNFASIGYDNFEDYFENFSHQTTKWRDGDEPELLYSIGSTFSYESYVGPVNLDFSYISGIEKFRIFFSVGFPLGRSF